MKKWSIESKVLGGFGFALAILAFVGVLVYQATLHYIEASRRVAQTHEALATLEEVFSLMNQAETGQRGYIITGEEAYLSRREAAIVRIASLLSQLSRLTADEAEQQQRMPELVRLIAARLTLLNRVLEALHADGFEAARQRLIVGSGKTEMDALRSLVSRMQEYERMRLEQRTAEEQEYAGRILLMFSLALLSAIVFLALLYRHIRYEIRGRKQVEERQAQLVHELESANEELRNFAYVVSHDLKAPLRAISSLADWVVTDYADKFDDEGREHMRLLLGRVRRMDGLIDGILQYSRVGRVKEAGVAVDLGQLVHEVIDLLSPPPNIAITIDNPLPTVVAERTRLQQLFQNLLSNAIKYMDKPGGKIRIGCVAVGNKWKLSVSDNGPGIEERHFEKIFQLFQTLAPRDRVESTGVGLALVKKIVEMYGGEVWVESKVGEGSTFFLTLPRSTQPTENLH